MNVASGRARDDELDLVPGLWGGPPGSQGQGEREGPDSRSGCSANPQLTFAVEDIDAVVAGLRARGTELVGELVRYEDSYRLCYVRGPEGIIVELAERIG